MLHLYKISKIGKLIEKGNKLVGARVWGIWEGVMGVTANGYRICFENDEMFKN